MCHCKPNYFTFCGGGTEFFYIRAIWAEGRLVLWGEFWSLPSSFFQFWQQLRDGGYVGGQSKFKSTLTQQYIQALLRDSSCGDSKNNFKGKWTFLEGGDFFDAENTALNGHASLSYKELMWTGLNGVIFFFSYNFSWLYRKWDWACHREESHWKPTSASSLINHMLSLSREQLE